jgi:hypothetical protein
LKLSISSYQFILKGCILFLFATKGHSCGLPERNIPLPIKELKGFKRLNIERGEKKNVQVDIAQSSLRYWDESVSAFVNPKGAYTVMIGASSDDIRMKKK